MTKKQKTQELYCCGCQQTVLLRLTNGAELYPHRHDLAAQPFWKCDACGNFVGCHHKTGNPTRPLGCIPTRAIKNKRLEIHRMIDPIWQSGQMPRGKLYREIARRIGRPRYHTAEIDSLEAAEAVLTAVRAIRIDIQVAAQ